MKYPNFIGPAYRSQSKIAAADECINLYPELVESNSGNNRMVLYGTPGLELHCTLPKSPVRCLWAGDNRLFAVAGDTVYEIFAGGTFSALGAISNDATPATMVSNGNQLMIVSGSKVWVSNGGAPVQPQYPPFAGVVNTNGAIVSWVSGDRFTADMVGGTMTINGSPYVVLAFYDESNIDLALSAGVQTAVPYSIGVLNDVEGVAGAYLDGYFIVLRPNSNQINISGLLNGLSWDELDFAIRSGGQDRVVTIFADHQELWLMGQKTIEVWYNSGNAGFPFERIQGSFIDEGIIAPWSVAKGAGAILWLAGDDRGAGWVMAATGYQPRRVSTFAVEYAIGTYGTITDAIAYTYTEKGHTFYVLTFPAANATWVYDVGMDLWHQRMSAATTNAALPRFHATTFGNTHFVGGATGKIYKASIAYFTEEGATVRRRRTAPHLQQEGILLFHRSLQLLMQQGVVPGSGPGSAPNVTLNISSDGGNTFGPDLTVAAGTAGQFTKRAIWRRLGRARDRVYRVTIAEPIEVAFVDAFLKIDGGDGS